MGAGGRDGSRLAAVPFDFFDWIAREHIADAGLHKDDDIVRIGGKGTVDGGETFDLHVADSEQRVAANRKYDRILVADAEGFSCEGNTSRGIVR